MTPTVLHRAAPTSVRDGLVVLLAVTSGATDAVGFLALGSAFTSVMTGNMVLFGMGLARGDGAALALTAVAIGSFVTGAALGARIAGSPRTGDPVWPRRIRAALGVELALFAVFALAWWGLGAAPPEPAFLPLLALNAVALGIQSSAIQRFGVPGLSTTYLTGTLTSVVGRLVSGHGLRAVGHSLTILAGLVAGAGLGATLVRVAPAAVPLVQLVPVGLVLLGSRLVRA
ncbi:YoaK family protein [Arthrobacter sp. NEB 688]|uniref:YoaK family protein n=1 Tax=Arthrobacter sp. NEB 688 TaxID=904039 RepID=UPI0015658380|nr:YoaK family protein [Arthrobacter sp. NEB 688]QKE83571.1 DUF1275 domain-containing protein [Arthrobacter sp. NEB 688]